MHFLLKNKNIQKFVFFHCVLWVLKFLMIKHLLNHVVDRVRLFDFCVLRRIWVFSCLSWFHTYLFNSLHVLCIMLLCILCWVLNNFWSHLYLLVFGFRFLVFDFVEIKGLVFFIENQKFGWQFVLFVSWLWLSEWCLV